MGDAEVTLVRNFSERQMFQEIGYEHVFAWRLHAVSACSFSHGGRGPLFTSARVLVRALFFADQAFHPPKRTTMSVTIISPENQG